MSTQQTPRQWFFSAAVLAAVGLWAAPGQAQIPVLGGMLDPAIDEPGKPFSYFWHPTDVIGVLYAPVASEVTPEGYLSTGFGELMFFVGIPPEPVDVRIKTLDQGYLPIVQYEFCRHEVKFAVTMFAADLGGKLQGLPVNFAEARLENEAGEPRTAFFSSAYRFSPPLCCHGGGRAAYRFNQRFDLIPKQYTDGQTQFNANWQYSFGPGAVIRDGRVLYTFPPAPEPEQFTLSLADKGFQLYRYFTGDVAGNRDPKHVSSYDTPMGVVTYRVPLRPREARTLVFKMPLAPIPAGTPEAKQVIEADCAEHLGRTVSFWRDLVGKSPPLRFPENKVQETLLANTVFDLLAIDKIGDNYITNVNKFQYHDFYGGSDSSHMRVGFDYLGLDQIARRTILYSIAYQFPDGSFDQRGQGGSPYYEFLGWNLWCLGRHYQLTRDASFLRQVYPGVVKAMEYEMRTTGKDPLGLFPPYLGITDDAALNGIRQIGPNIWALHGMRHAIAMAQAMGSADDARRFQAEEQRFRAALEKQLVVQTAQERRLDSARHGKDLARQPLGQHDALVPRAALRPVRSPRDGHHPQVPRDVCRGHFGLRPPGSHRQEGGRVCFQHQAGAALLAHAGQRRKRPGARRRRRSAGRGPGPVRPAVAHDVHARAAGVQHRAVEHPRLHFRRPPARRRGFGKDHRTDAEHAGPRVSGRPLLVLGRLARLVAAGEENRNSGRADDVRPRERRAFCRGGRLYGAIVEPIPPSAASTWCFACRGSTRFRRPRPTAGRSPSRTENFVVAPGTREIKVKGRFRPSAPDLSFERTVAQYKQEYRKRYADFLRTGAIQP